MKTASVQDLHAKTSEFIRDVEHGETIVIARHGKAIAELKPVENKPAAQTATTFKWPDDMEEIWNTFPQFTEDYSTRFISEDRDRW